MELFHPTLKSMLGAIAMNSRSVMRLSLVLFAVREDVQESLGFSPAELALDTRFCDLLTLL